MMRRLLLMLPMRIVAAYAALGAANVYRGLP